MSPNNIIKTRTPQGTAGFRFPDYGQDLMEGNSPRALEAEAELDAFNEPGQPMSAQQLKSAALPQQQQGTHLQPHQIDVTALIARAQDEASAIIRSAQDQAHRIEKDAYEKGIAEGHRTGEIMAEQQLQAMMHIYQQTLSGLDQARELLMNQYQLDFLDLVLHTAQKVVHTEIRLNPSVIVPMIKEALNQLKQRRNATIYLNPDDHRHLFTVSEAEKVVWFGTQVVFEIDGSLSRGSFRIETPQGELDARIETAFQMLNEQIQQAIEQS